MAGEDAQEFRQRCIAAFQQADALDVMISSLSGKPHARWLRPKHECVDHFPLHQNARVESCRIIDQFAERTGDAAWQTAITMEGVNTLRRLLRKTARRNTAVACHWLKKNGQTELLWIVGSLRRFNAQGRVPTNRTTRPQPGRCEELRWQCAESIALLAAIAGLFHDFGKAGHSFQASLTGKDAKRYQPYRHEWISVRLFQAFVGEQADEEWLDKLGRLTPVDEPGILERLCKDHQTFTNSPFRTLPPLAKTVRLADFVASPPAGELPKQKYGISGTLR